MTYRFLRHAAATVGLSLSVAAVTGAGSPAARAQQRAADPGQRRAAHGPELSGAGVAAG
jgi:hypothetical protein